MMKVQVARFSTFIFITIILFLGIKTCFVLFIFYVCDLITDSFSLGALMSILSFYIQFLRMNLYISYKSYRSRLINPTSILIFSRVPGYSSTDCKDRHSKTIGWTIDSSASFRRRKATSSSELFCCF